VSKVNIHPDHLRKSGGKLKDFGGQVSQAGEKLEETGQNLVSHASGDRSGVGAVVAKAMGRGVEVTGTVFKEGGRVAGSAGGRLGTTADLFEEADDTATKGLRKAHPGAKGKVDPPGGSSRGGSSVGGGGGSGREDMPVAGGSTRTASAVGGGGGGKDREVPSLSGDLTDPPKSTRDYDSSGKTIDTRDLKHPQQDLLDSSAIKKAKEMPPAQRASNARRPGVGADHPAVKSIVPSDYDPTGGLGEKGWDKKYWPSGQTDEFGNRDLTWPDPQTHPNGFESPEGRTPSVLQEGTRIDRFGPGFGRFTSPPGTPFPERGLPPENLVGTSYHQYEVVRPIPVWEGRIAEAMGQPGGGTQYFMPEAVVDLVNAGYLREVAL
jgi:hypothetical protein